MPTKQQQQGDEARGAKKVRVWGEGCQLLEGNQSHLAFVLAVLHAAYEISCWGYCCLHGMLVCTILTKLSCVCLQPAPRAPANGGPGAQPVKAGEGVRPGSKADRGEGDKRASGGGADAAERKRHRESDTGKAKQVRAATPLL